MLYESEPVQFRHTFRLWNKTEINTSDSNQGRRVIIDQGLELAQVWLHSEISHFEGWQNNGRGFIV